MCARATITRRSTFGASQTHNCIRVCLLACSAYLSRLPNYHNKAIASLACLSFTESFVFAELFVLKLNFLLFEVLPTTIYYAKAILPPAIPSQPPPKNSSIRCTFAAASCSLFFFPFISFACQLAGATHKCFTFCIQMQNEILPVSKFSEKCSMFECRRWSVAALACVYNRSSFPPIIHIEI